MVTRRLLVTCLMLAACDGPVSHFLFHTPVETRVRDCLHGSIPWPQDLPGNSGTTSFAVLTDPHFGDPDSVPLGWLRSQLARLNMDFFVVLGDITDNGLPAQYEQARLALDSLGLPYFCTTGNHDLYESDGWQNFKQTFGPSCYSVLIAGRLRLIFLDTADGTLGPTQFDWLETTLETDTAHFRIVLTHFPLYDGTTPTVFRLASPTERYKLQHLLNRHRVNALVAGHIHGWRYTRINSVDHFIAGSMAPGHLDYGTRGFLVFNLFGDSLHWSRVEYP
ncbi:MAG: metallophosphoesterase [candidate division WOR-3 bacterium]